MKRVLLAGLYHETHTFLEGLTRLDDCEVRRGRELIPPAGDSSPMAGAVEVLQDRGWDVVPSVDVRAPAGPTAADEVVDLFWRDFEPSLRDCAKKGIDGVFFVLHGAMVSESLDDVEGEVLRRTREIIGPGVPVGGVIDLHANFTGTMARCASALIAYRENPHTDAKESAIRAMRTLVRLIESGDLPDTVWERPAILWAPTGTGTATDPMLSLERRAREIEREHSEILAVNVIPGFAFADVPEAGVSFTAVTLGDPAAARLELASLSRLAHDLKDLGVSADIPVDEAMRKLAAHREGPIVLVEPSDNVGGGAPGDGTGLLRALVGHRVRGAVVINDPAAVAKLAAAKIGASLRLPIGGKGSRLDPGPLVLDIEYVSQSDGRFSLEDPHSHLASMVGSQVDMGPCAVVRHEGVTILLTSKKTPPFDLGQLRSQGIVPEEQFAIVVKAAVAHARAYDPISKASYWVDTPGPCSGNLKSLPYRKVRRPIYPLDSVRARVRN